MQPLRGEIIDGTQRFKKNRPLNPGRAARLSLVPGLGHWYAGAPLRLTLSSDGGASETHILGVDLATGAEPQRVVPAGLWQTARSLGDWTLVGCTVAPGFDFAGFELAPEGWEPG